MKTIVVHLQTSRCFHLSKVYVPLNVYCNQLPIQWITKKAKGHKTFGVLENITYVSFYWF